MAVRRQCNRYKTEPYGTDFDIVLKKAKAFFKDGTFMIVDHGGIYHSCTPSLPPFTNPEGARIFQKIEHRWVEQ